MAQTLLTPPFTAASDRADVIARLKLHAPEIAAYLVTGLYLFGSAARDELSPESDIDVFIDYDPDGPFSFVELIRLGEFLQLKLGRKVDLMTRAGLHRRLRADIEKSSVRVF